MAHKIIQDFRKRRNAAKWKHQKGDKIHKPYNHRSILDNGWIPMKRLKNPKFKNGGFIPFGL